MSIIDTKALLELLEGDRDFLEALTKHGIIASGERYYSPEEVEAVLVSRTLVQELEINWAGVDVILRMRRQLLVTRLRLAEVSNDPE